MNLRLEIQRLWRIFHSGGYSTRNRFMGIVIEGGELYFNSGYLPRHATYAVMTVAEMRNNSVISREVKSFYAGIRYNKVNLMLYDYIDDEFIKDCLDEH